MRVWSRRKPHHRPGARLRLAGNQMESIRLQSELAQDDGGNKLQNLAQLLERAELSGQRVERIQNEQNINKTRLNSKGEHSREGPILSSISGK